MLGELKGDFGGDASGLRLCTCLFTLEPSDEAVKPDTKGLAPGPKLDNIEAPLSELDLTDHGLRYAKPRC